MTDHPMTDEICREVADSMLEQLKEEVKTRLRVWRKSGYCYGADAAEDFFEEVIQQMRPQEES